MKKLGALLFATALLSISLYGLYSRSYYLETMFSISAPFILLREGLAIILLAYVFLEPLRNTLSKYSLGLLGVGLLGVGIAGVISPTLFGHTTTYVPIGDVLIFIEGGIFAIVLSAELPARSLVFLSAGSLLYLTFVFTLDGTARAKQLVSLLILIGGVTLVTKILSTAAKLRSSGEQELETVPKLLSTA